MNKIIVQKLKSLPKTPGVYLFRNDKNRVIYVGKAISLKNRVTSYFRGEHDKKTEELVRNITNLEWIEVESEFEALIVEADLIKRYKPKYNIRLRDDKNYVYLKIGKEEYPRISISRQTVDSEARYLGPFTDANALRSVLKAARYVYPYCSCQKREGETCLYYHLGLCPGHDEKLISAKEYRKNIQGLVKLFSGKTDKIETEIKRSMNKASQKKEFETAAQYRDKLTQIKKIKHMKLFSNRELSTDIGLKQLADGLAMAEIPRRIECFDISNVMGTAAVGSMVVFKNGIASPKDYRRFQIKTVKGANDFASMAEVLKRRFKESEKSKPDKSFVEMPDLVILDGGKGQLSTVLENAEIPENVKVVALAKQFEEIYSSSELELSSRARSRDLREKISPPASLGRNDKFERTILPLNSEAYFLVQRIRDEAHRFAITYHRNLKSKDLFETSLDAIPGVGPKTKKKLIAHFGSIKKIKEASSDELASVVGKTLANRIQERL